MALEAKRFIQNAQAYAKITNEKLPSGLSKDEVIGRMKSNVAICRQLMIENNQFIDACLKPFFSEPESMGNDDARQLR